jgi:hypothetical protein
MNIVEQLTVTSGVSAKEGNRNSQKIDHSQSSRMLAATEFTDVEKILFW